MKKFSINYSDPRMFTFMPEYKIIEAETEEDAIKIFKETYPRLRFNYVNHNDKEERL